MSSKKQTDFFNLNSEESENEEEKAEEAFKQEEIKKKIEKWNWDQPENFDLYYKYNYNKIETSSTKRSLLVNNDQFVEEEIINKKMKPSNVFIDQVGSSNNSSSFTPALLFNLTGHTSSVNRINWCKINKNVLLSSSMDRFRIFF